MPSSSLPRPPHHHSHQPAVAQVVHRIRTSVVHEVLPLVADAWNPNVLLMVWLGCHRFEQLVEALGISRSALTPRLALLQEKDCLLRDSSGGGHAPYKLTPRGEALLPVILLNRQWNARWGISNRIRPDLTLIHDCGAALDLRAVCLHCGGNIDASDVKILELPGAAPDVQAPPPPPAYRRGRRTSGATNDGALQSEDLAGDRWTSLILAVAYMGLRRNSEIEQAIGIAPNMLAHRLTLLTSNDVFSRVQYQDSPPRFEYQLTPKGLDRYAVVAAMVDWGVRWVRTTRPDWSMLHMPCSEWLHVNIICACCAKPATTDTIRPTESVAPQR